jgi:hypothetical protein
MNDKPVTHLTPLKTHLTNERDLLMKTISLETDEPVYSTILNFLRLLPAKQCRLIDDDDTLTPPEIAHLQAIRTQQ